MRKKITAALLTAAILCFSACSGGGEQPQTSAEEEAPAEIAPVSEITAAVLADVPINSVIEKGVIDLGPYFGSLDTEGIEEVSYCMCASGAYPDEIAVFKFSSEELAEKGLEAVKERMEQQRSTYETYTPQEMYKFDGAAAETRGCYVIYLITADNDAAGRIVSEFIP